MNQIGVKEFHEPNLLSAVLMLAEWLDENKPNIKDVVSNQDDELGNWHVVVYYYR